MYKAFNTRLGETFLDASGVRRKLYYTDIGNPKTKKVVQTIMSPTRKESLSKAKKYASSNRYNDW